MVRLGLRQERATSATRAPAGAARDGNQSDIEHSHLCKRRCGRGDDGVDRIRHPQYRHADESTCASEGIRL